MHPRPDDAKAVLGKRIRGREPRLIGEGPQLELENCVDVVAKPLEVLLRRHRRDVALYAALPERAVSLPLRRAHCLIPPNGATAQAAVAPSQGSLGGK